MFGSLGNIDLDYIKLKSLYGDTANFPKFGALDSLGKRSDFLSSPYFSRFNTQTALDSSSYGSSDGSAYDTWVEWFCSLAGNEFFCEVPEEYITDDFNLAGLREKIPKYRQALDTILDREREEYVDDAEEDIIDSAAEMLYGMIHARYILTSRGLQAMAKKFDDVAFGRCHRVFCQGQKLLPVGQSDVPRKTTVNVFCPRCREIYFPKSSRQCNVDGAYFGTTFAHFFLLTFPNRIPRSAATYDKPCEYKPRIFGFKIHKSSVYYHPETVRRRRRKGHSSRSSHTSAATASKSQTQTHR